MEKKAKITNSYYKFEDLMGLSYGQLNDMLNKGHKYVDILEKSKVYSISMADLKGAIGFTMELEFLKKNIGFIGVAMSAKEEETVEYGDIETIWRN